MKNNSIEATEALENLETYIKRTILVKISYLLLVLFLHFNFFPMPRIIFIAISLMIIYAVTVFFLVHKYTVKSESIINTLFLLVLLDLLLITVIINFLGITVYIVYSFYIILGFMTLPRNKAIQLVACVIILYLGLIFLQYFQIFQPIQLFSVQETNLQNFTYVFALLSLYLVTLLFLGVRCYDFYSLITGRINALRGAYLTLENEKRSLERKVQTRKDELREQKEGLGQKVKDKKKELEKENTRIEEKIRELEGFRASALGREMKVKELKGEIEKLKNKISFK